MLWTDDDRICGNCAHWQEERGIPLRHGVTYAPCALEMERKGVELSDAPGSVALMSAFGNCRNYGDCWEPSAAYLEEQRYAEDARQADRRPWHGQFAVGL